MGSLSQVLEEQRFLEQIPRIGKLERRHYCDVVRIINESRGIYHRTDEDYTRGISSPYLYKLIQKNNDAGIVIKMGKEIAAAVIIFPINYQEFLAGIHTPKKMGGFPVEYVVENSNCVLISDVVIKEQYQNTIVEKKVKDVLSQKTTGRECYAIAKTFQEKIILEKMGMFPSKEYVDGSVLFYKEC